MRKINWRWFRVFREEQPDLLPEHHRAEEALDSGDIDISPPPQSAFWKSLHTLDETVLKIMIAFLVATLILFVIIFYQQGVISKQQKELTKIPKFKQSVKFKNEAIAVKNKTIVSQAATITWLQNRLNLKVYYEKLAKQAEKDWREVQKNEDRGY